MEGKEDTNEFATTTAVDAFVGFGTNVTVEPTLRLAGFGATVSVPVSAGSGALTVTDTVAVLKLLVQHAPEPLAVTVIVAAPAETAVTTPLAVTEAMPEALDE